MFPGILSKFLSSGILICLEVIELLVKWLKRLLGLLGS